MKWVKTILRIHYTVFFYLYRKLPFLEIRRIILTHFRNHSKTVLDLNHRVVGISGPNGVGKTSILEAIHYLAVSRGMSSAVDVPYLQKGASFFRLEGMFVRGDEETQLVIKYQPRKGKTLEVDGEKIARLGDHIGRYPIVSMVPQDIDLLLSGSRERRRIMDMAFSQIDRDYLENLMIYRRILKQRNAYLKSTGRTPNFKLAMLTAFDKRMSGSAAVIFEKRKMFTEELKDQFNDFYLRISSGKEEVFPDYQSELESHDFETLAQKNLEKDRIMGRTHGGVHKDDLELCFLGGKLKDSASQGQLKSAVLALKMAVWELIRNKTGIDPVFLLDDLFDRLDEQRAAAFLSLVKERSGGQIFITDTNSERLRKAMDQLKVDCFIFAM